MIEKARISKEIVFVGFAIQLQDIDPCRKSIENVIAVLPGSKGRNHANPGAESCSLKSCFDL